MEATLATFREQFPELAAVTDELVERSLAFAKEIHTANVLCTLYLTAHLATVPIDQETPGEVKSETVGPKSAAYWTQATSGDDAFYTRTEYGRRFLVLERRTTTGLFKMRVL